MLLQYLTRNTNAAGVIVRKLLTQQICGPSVAKCRKMSASANNVVKENGWEEGTLLQKVMELVKQENLASGMESSKKVIEFQHPKDLEKILQLGLTREGLSFAQVEELLEKVVKYSVKTQHPHFYNQQYGGIDEVALTGAWLTDALNTNQHTYEVAPVFILMERFIIQHMISLFGWPEGDGIFSGGGSMSNMYGMLLARYRLYPDVKRTGIFGRKPLVIFTSDQSHYSFAKGASVMGIGMDNVISVATDSCGRMLPQALREEVAKARARGGEPFFVNASAGTTVLGSFDPFEDIADVCQEEGLWMHIDACWGGSVILSKTHRHNLNGIQRADSVSWNPHKMIGTTLQCSPFFVRHKGLLHECNSASATYLFQQDKFYDVSYDTGDKSIQCGRKVDAFKLYFLLSTKGMDLVEKKIDAAFSASDYLNEQLGVRPGFRRVIEKPQCTNTCFWYIPPSLRDQPETPEWWEKLSKVPSIIKARMVQEGTMMIGYQPLASKNLVNFFRLVNTSTPMTTNADMDFVLDEIERLGKDL